MNSPSSRNGTTELDEQSALAGDANAFGVIVTSYEQRVFAFIGRMGFVIGQRQRIWRRIHLFVCGVIARSSMRDAAL